MSLVHPRIGPRRGRAWARTWWGKAWQRAVEEAAYDEVDLRRARTLARGAAVGGIVVDPGRARSAVEDRDDLWSVGLEVPVLDVDARAALVEVVAAEVGRVAALLAGDLPHDLVEHAEEAGVELLPYGGELVASCTCSAWVDPCPHALAVLLQLGWLVEDDPLLLVHLRGVERSALLADLHERAGAGLADGDARGASVREQDDLLLETAVEAAEQAARWLADLDDPTDGGGCAQPDGPGRIG